MAKPPGNKKGVAAAKKGKGSPPFDHLTLQDGDKLTGDDFPLIYNSN